MYSDTSVTFNLVNKFKVTITSTIEHISQDASGEVFYLTVTHQDKPGVVYDQIQGCDGCHVFDNLVALRCKFAGYKTEGSES